MKRLLMAVAGMLAMGGCSRVAVTTEVKPDGSWTRTDVFAQSTSNSGQSAQLSDVFVMPAKALADGLICGVWGAIFGPGQSILPQIMLQPDSVERVLLSRLSRSVGRTLGETLGSKLTKEERRETVLRLIKGMAASAKSRSGAKSPGGSEDKDGTDLPTLTFVMRPPGRVSDTNGDLDKYSNEVMWTVYPEAAALGDVVLKATWDEGK